MKKKELDSLDQLMIKCFPNEIVRKSYIHTISSLKQFPNYVKECLISDHMEEDGTLFPDAINYINSKVQKSTPDKKDKEILGSRLIELGNIELIDHYQVHTDLRKGKYFTNVPILDSRATVDRELVMPGPESYQDLLKGGLWGSASLEYVKSGEYANINLNKFESFQTGTPSLKKYINQRKNFTKDEWLDLIIRTLGMNPKSFSLREKWLYITRLIPLVEKFSNSLEFGPPQTGKSYLFENISEHVRMLLGGEITPAKLIYDQNNDRNGLVFTKDVLVFDEINKTNSKLRRIIPNLQQIMASNRAERGDLDAMTDICLHFQGNPIKKGETDFLHEDCIKMLPAEMYDCAFLDRLHRYIHGWEFSRFSPEYNNQNLGLLISYFGQICHRIRSIDVDALVSDKIQLARLNSDGERGNISSRDNNAVRSTLSGLIKLVFPHQILNDKEWEEIIQLSIELRQNVIDEMVKIDPNQYRKLTFNLKTYINTLNFDEIKISSVIDDDSQIKEEICELNGVMDEFITQEISKADTIIKEMKEEEILFPSIHINENNQITEKIPYWYVKILIDGNYTKVKNGFLWLNPNKECNFKINLTENPPIPIELSNPSQSTNYYSEEQKSGEFIQKLNLLKSKINDFSIDIAQVKNYQKVLKNYYCVEEPSPENSLLLMNFEDLLQELPLYDEVKIQNLLKKIKSEIDGIIEIAAKNPDLLQYDFHPFIIPHNTRFSQIDSKIKEWSKFHSNYIIDVRPLITKAAELKINLQKLFSKDKKQLLDGKKFTLFAIDMNNFHKSLHEHYKKKYPSKNIRHSICMIPLAKKLMEFFKQNEPYYILFFVSKYIEGYKKKFIEVDHISEWFIEGLRKYDKFVDVDANLTSYTSLFLERHCSQISDFYLCCGDIDLHSVIDIAQKKSISAKILAPFKNTLNSQYIDIADDYFTLFDN